MKVRTQFNYDTFLKFNYGDRFLAIRNAEETLAKYWATRSNPISRSRIRSLANIIRMLRGVRMDEELVTWVCPQCDEENPDPSGSETHCAKCGLVDDEDAISQEWYLIIKNDRGRIVEGKAKC